MGLSTIEEKEIIGRINNFMQNWERKQRRKQYHIDRGVWENNPHNTFKGTFDEYCNKYGLKY